MSQLVKTYSCDNKNNTIKQQACGVGHFLKRKGEGLVPFLQNGLGSSHVRHLPLLYSPLATSPSECPCEGARDRKRKREMLKKEKEAVGSKDQPYPADYQPIRRGPGLSRRQQRGK